MSQLGRAKHQNGVRDLWAFHMLALVLALALVPAAILGTIKYQTYPSYPSTLLLGMISDICTLFWPST